jgi:hypothetical protein
VASFLFFVILPLKGTTGKFTLQWKNENKQKIFYRGIKAQLAIEALKEQESLNFPVVMWYISQLGVMPENHANIIVCH